MAKLSAPPQLPVDQSWLQDVICQEHGAKESIQKVTCEIIGEGKGFLSVITKVTIDWSNSNGGGICLLLSIYPMAFHQTVSTTVSPKAK